jgi:hypothetical protein
MAAACKRQGGDDRRRKGMNLRTGVTLLLLLLLISRTPSMMAQAAMAEVMVTGQVMINDVAVTSGSTFFGGSRLRTGVGSRAIVNLRRGTGLLAVEAGSDLRLNRMGEGVGIELMRGDMLLRLRTPSMVTVLGVTIRSESDNVYRVAADDQGITVNALDKPLTVVAEGRETTLSAGHTYTSWEEAITSAPALSSPQQPSPQPRRQRRAVIIPALIIGALAISLGLTVAHGEKTKVVSPVAPRR